MYMLGKSSLFIYDHNLTEANQSISAIISLLEQFSEPTYVLTADACYFKTRFRKYFHNLRWFVSKLRYVKGETVVPKRSQRKWKGTHSVHCRSLYLDPRR